MNCLQKFKLIDLSCDCVVEGYLRSTSEGGMGTGQACPVAVGFRMLSFSKSSKSNIVCRQDAWMSELPEDPRRTFTPRERMKCTTNQRRGSIPFVKQGKTVGVIPALILRLHRLFLKPGLTTIGRMNCHSNLRTIHLPYPLSKGRGRGVSYFWCACNQV